jgi:hypothetical protein
MQATGIPPDLSATWWQAVKRSQSSEVVQWRQELLLLQSFGDPVSLATTVWTPRRCLAILDRLYQEQRLRHADRVLLQEYSLRKVDARGAWK